jgi:hypothetical protein
LGNNISEKENHQEKFKRDGHLEGAKDKRRDCKRGAEEDGGRRRGRGAEERGSGALAADMSERESDPPLRQAISACEGEWGEMRGFWLGF